MTEILATPVINLRINGARGATGIEIEGEVTPGQFLVKAPGGPRKFATATGTGADEGLRTDLATATGAANIGYRRAGTTVTRDVADKLDRDLPITPFDGFGAVGDKETDDTAALADLASVVNALTDGSADASTIGYYPRVELPPCEGFITTETIALDAAVEIVMHSPLWVDAAADTPIIGLHYKDFSGVYPQSPRDRAPVFDIRRLTQSDWSSEDDIGLLIDSAYNLRATIRRTMGFTVGFDICAGYGILYLGDHRRHKLCRIASRGTPDVQNFSNHIRLFGGQFSADGVGIGLDRYGLVIEGRAPFGINTVVLDGQSYELQSVNAGGGDSIPIVIDGTASNVIDTYALNQRSESNGNTNLRALGEVRNVYAEFVHHELEYANPSSLMVDDQSTYGGSIMAVRKFGAAAPQWKRLFETGLLSRKAVKLTGNSVTLQNMEAMSNAGGGTTQTFSFGATNPTFDANGFMTASGPYFGIRVKLNGERSLAISGVKPSGQNVDARLVCFDSSGAQISTEGAVFNEQSASPVNTGIYGGLYTVGIAPANTATAFDGVIAFTPDVDTVFIAISTPVSCWTLKSLYGRSEWFSSTSHFRDQFVGEAAPIALTNVTYPDGMRVIDATPAAGGTEGWVLVGGAWKTFGAVSA